MSEIIPVIHVVSREQTLMNLGMCIANDLKKVFLINHQVSREFLLNLAKEAKELLPNMWVGVNMLGTPVEEALNMDLPVDAIWCDQTVKTNQRKFKGEVFGGLAFKYQAQPKDIAEACKEAIQCTTVATTSGPGTGKAASYDKIKHLRDCLGSHPLALASGVNPKNIKAFAPYVNYMLVATSITNSDETLNPQKLKELQEALAGVQPRQPLPEEAFRTTRKPFCQCLHEIRNGLNRTKFCFVPCHDQEQILAEEALTKKQQR